MTALDRVLWLPPWMQAAAAAADFGRPGYDRIACVDGFDWYSNDQAALRDIERTSRPAPTEGHVSHRMAELLATPRVPVMPLCRALLTNGDRVVRMADLPWMMDGVWLFERYERLVEQLYPGATWLCPDRPSTGLAAWVRGAIVALVAPYYFTTAEVLDGG